MNYEKDLREMTDEENRVLKLSPEERAEYFSRRYYRFFFHARTGKQVTEQDMQKAVETLTPWFQANPKRMIPDPQVMFELAPIGKPSVLHSSLYGYYEGALDRDYKQVAWRK